MDHPEWFHSQRRKMISLQYCLLSSINAVFMLSNVWRQKQSFQLILTLLQQLTSFCDSWKFTWWVSNLTSPSPSLFLKLKIDHCCSTIPTPSLCDLWDFNYLSGLEISYLLSMEWFSKRKHGWYFLGSKHPLFVGRECSNSHWAVSMLNRP